MEQPASGRKYELRKPYEYKGKLVFLTPRDYLQIDSLEKDGKKIDPLSLVEEKFI
jgi:hypothetical protein